MEVHASTDFPAWHILQYRNRRPVHLQAVEIERGRKQHSSLHVNNVSAGQIVAEVGPVQQCLSRARLEGLHLDGGVLIISGSDTGNKQDCSASRQMLRKSM